MKSKMKLSDEDLLKLKEKGYEIIAQIGSGGTRTVYEAIYRSGSLQKTVIIKVPDFEINQESARTVINLSRRDVNDNEAGLAGKLRHPNIAEILDSIELGPGRTANVEEFFEAESLDKIVKDGLKERDVRRIFSGVLEGAAYLEEEGVLHRDWKPANILVGDKEVKITDLQNAVRIEDLEEKSLPTGGKISYSQPKFLNDFLNDKGAASKKTEAYALGATLYYMLTGKDAFDYKLDSRFFENGSIIVDGEEKTSISQEAHDQRLETALKMVPRKYRKILRKSLSFERGYDSVAELKRDFERLQRKGSIWTKLGLAAAGLGILAAGSLMPGLHEEVKQKKGTAARPFVLEQESHREAYRRQFRSAYDTLKESVIDGDVKNRLPFDSPIIDKAAEEYGLDPGLVRRMLDVNRVYAGEDGLGRDLVTQDINILDVFAISNKPRGHSFHPDQRIIDPVDNLRYGAKRLSDLIKKHENLDDALYEFYMPTGIKWGSTWNKTTYLEPQMAEVREDIRSIVYNAKEGIERGREFGFPSRSLKDPPEDFYRSKPIKGLEDK